MDGAVFPLGVTLYAPTSSDRYYRIAYYPRAGASRVKKSAGSSFGKAMEKVATVTADLKAQVTDHQERPVAELITAYLAAKEPGWAPKHHHRTKGLLTNAQGREGGVRCADVDRGWIRDAIARASTAGEKDRTRIALSGMVKWGVGEEWLPNAAEWYMRGTKPDRAAKNAGRAHGSSVEYIEAKFIPSPEDVQRAAAAAEARWGEQGWLMVAMAASTGMRRGEVLDLRAGYLDFDEGEVRVLTQVVHEPGKPPVQTLPKGGFTRTTVLPDGTLWGAPFAARLAEWVKDMGPDELVFPTRRKPRKSETAWLSPSNFDTNLWRPARDAAGWKPKWTWHSMRHTFCSTALKHIHITDVSTMAGHQEVGTTMRMYVKATEGVTERARAAFPVLGSDFP